MRVSSSTLPLAALATAVMAVSASAITPTIERFPVADFGAGKRDGLPPYQVGGRVLELMTGEHFDDALRDTPDEMRPPSVVLFFSHKSPCADHPLISDFELAAERELPSRERLLIAKYNVDAAPFRTWFRFTPEMDLAKRFHVEDACPVIAFVPRSCNGWTEYCEDRVADTGNPDVYQIGCEDFKDQCAGVELWNPATAGRTGEGDWRLWVQARIKRGDEPRISPVMGTYAKQRAWLERRESTTVTTHRRNTFLSPRYMPFTSLGYKAMPIPDPVWDWLQSFYKRHYNAKQVEGWDTTSTQINFHEAKTTFVDLDLERAAVNRLANEYLKPIVEEWTNLPNGLELTSFYGIRAYPPGAFLRNHIDRVDTHVISLTLSLGKLNEDGTLAPEGMPEWPLEFIDWRGERVRYAHPPKSMILYESAKGIHGRPFRNKGAWHLGAFCHFKPKAVDTGIEWREVSTRAKTDAEKEVRNKMRISMPTVEPRYPKFTSERLGEDGFKAAARQRGPAVSEDMIKVVIVNKDTVTRDVYWLPGTGAAPVLQYTLTPGEEFEVTSFRGHVFFVADVGERDPAAAVQAAPKGALLTVPETASGRVKTRLEFVPPEAPTCGTKSASVE